MTLTTDRRAGLLAATPLFADLDTSGMETVAQRAVEISFEDGHVIARQGDIGTGFFVIATGAVRVVRDGHQIAHLGAGEFFGELSVLDGRPRTAQVIADGSTTCLALATWDFEAVVTEQPAVAIAIMRVLAKRLRDLTEGTHH
jgi:CRP-like cAMP-binding protein